MKSTGHVFLLYTIILKSWTSKLVKSESVISCGSGNVTETIDLDDSLNHTHVTGPEGDPSLKALKYQIRETHV